MKSINNFLIYNKLNEITKFSNIKNFLSLSKIKKIIVWINVNPLSSDSKFIFYTQGLLSFFLIYLITCKRPILKKSFNNQSITIYSSISSPTKLKDFLGKLIILYNLETLKDNYDILDSSLVRFIISDFKRFLDIDNSLDLFKSIPFIYFDFFFLHNCKNRNICFLDSITKGY